MTKGRLEAFSDGVIAIIITIMVLELKTPDGADFLALVTLAPKFFSYVLSFVFIGIYWNNHHHLLQASSHVNGRVLWANLHLLFWLSLVPFATIWVGDSKFATAPVVFYGVDMWMSGLAYYFLVLALLASHPKDSPLTRALQSQVKEWLSLSLYTAAIALAFINPTISMVIYVVVASMWLIPDRRIESRMQK